MKGLTGKTIWIWFALFLGVELSLACTAYALLDHYDLIDTPCHDLFEEEPEEDEENCLVCVIKGSVRIELPAPPITDDRSTAFLPTAPGYRSACNPDTFPIRPPPSPF